jgi:hypothetical protein
MKKEYMKPAMQAVVIKNVSLLVGSGSKASKVNGNAFSGSIAAGHGIARSYDGGYDGDWGEDEE